MSEDHEAKYEHAATLGQLKQTAALSIANIGEAAKAAGEAIEEAYGIMAQKAVNNTIVIQAADWAQGSDADYPFYYDFGVDGLEAADCVGVHITANAEAALAAGICESPEVTAGKFRLKAQARPTENITALFCIFDGKEYEED